MREAAWLTEERVLAYSAMAVGAYFAVALLVLWTSHDLLDVNGQPVGTDFVSFWAAGSLALKGQAPEAYNLTAHAAQESAVFGGVKVPYFAWTYPPIFLLVVALLAALSYGWALLTWLVVTGTAYVICLGKLVPHPRTALVALASPGVLLNVGHGQNGFLSTALLGMGLWLLESQPVAAGVLFGALCYKPQMALLVPLALLAARQWRALWVMAATLLLLYGVTVAFFGRDVWFLAYDASVAIGKHRVLEQGAVDYFKMASIFSAVRLAGGSIALAWPVQWTVSITVSALVAWAWRSRASLDLKGALLVSAVPLATPFFLDYDLLVLAIPIAWLVRNGMREGFRPWERSTVVAAFAIAGLARPVGWLTGVPLAPLVELILLAALVERLRLGEIRDIAPKTAPWTEVDRNISYSSKQ